MTKDMIKLEQLPAALAPDTEYDEDGCFSGTAIEDKGRHMQRRHLLPATRETQ